MSEFVSAAFPWIILGIGVIGFVAFMASKDKKQK